MKKLNPRPRALFILTPDSWLLTPLSIPLRKAARLGHIAVLGAQQADAQEGH